jgi:uncharacterized membrane protein (UPF0127 family)
MTAMHPLPQMNEVRRALAALAAVMWLVAMLPADAQTAPLEDLAAFPSAPLEIADGKKVKHTFQVWLADNPNRQAQGLMFVRALPQLRGMLFVYPEPRNISMWMKNTYIPLDMVFIDVKGRVQQIVANTTPHSTELIRAKDPAIAVLEIAGGEAARLGIRPGQLVRHPALTRR